MKRWIIKPLVLGGSLFLFAVILAGCTCNKPGKLGSVRPYEIVVTLDKSLRTNSIIVDLVGVNPSIRPRLEHIDMWKYWDPNDKSTRPDLDPKVLDFVPGDVLELKMSAKDPKWNQWKATGVTHVMVLADLDLPGQAHTSGEGTQDPRRQILDLHKCVWPSGTSKIQVLVQPSGVKVLTPTRAAK
jgi:hypothetical protein